MWTFFRRFRGVISLDPQAVQGLELRGCSNSGEKMAGVQYKL